MITKVHPDAQKAQALIKMAMTTLQRLDETNTEKYPSNTFVDYYDAIHKLIEATTLSGGVKVKGEGAHQELIDYFASKYGVGEQTRQSLQQMRDYRNRIAYEGFTVSKNYVILNKTKITGIIQKLSDALTRRTEN